MFLKGEVVCKYGRTRYVYYNGVIKAPDHEDLDLTKDGKLWTFTQTLNLFDPKNAD